MGTAQGTAKKDIRKTRKLLPEVLHDLYGLIRAHFPEQESPYIFPHPMHSPSVSGCLVALVRENLHAGPLFHCHCKKKTNLFGH